MYYPHVCEDEYSYHLSAVPQSNMSRSLYGFRQRDACIALCSTNLQEGMRFAFLRSAIHFSGHLAIYCLSLSMHCLTVSFSFCLNVRIWLVVVCLIPIFVLASMKRLINNSKSYNTFAFKDRNHDRAVPLKVNPKPCTLQCVSVTPSANKSWWNYETCL